MVFETWPWIGLKVILKTESSWSSLAPLDPRTGKSHVVFHRVNDFAGCRFQVAG